MTGENEMEMPCECDECGGLFDLHDGNPCGYCDCIYCRECLPEPWEYCLRCLDGE